MVRDRQQAERQKRQSEFNKRQSEFNKQQAERDAELKRQQAEREKQIREQEMKKRDDDIRQLATLDHFQFCAHFHDFMCEMRDTLTHLQKTHDDDLSCIRERCDVIDAELESCTTTFSNLRDAMKDQ
jgi:hypothetical protein